MTTVPVWWGALDWVWKVIIAIGAGAGGLTFIWKVVTAIWKWWRTRDESAVLELMRGRENAARAMIGNVVPEPATVLFISGCLKMKAQRVHNALVRLERKDKVHRVPGGWQFGPTPVSAMTAPGGDAERWKRPWE